MPLCTAGLDPGTPLCAQHEAEDINNISENAPFIIDERVEAFIDAHVGAFIPEDAHENMHGEAAMSEAEMLLREKASIPIYEGSHITVLDAMLDVLHLQVRHNMTNASVTDIMRVVSKSLPPHLQHCYPSNHADLKKVLKAVGFEYQTIHCCPQNCVLYWGQYEKATLCPKCGVNRYKEHTKGKSLPKKVHSSCTSVSPPIFWIYGAT